MTRVTCCAALLAGLTACNGAIRPPPAPPAPPIAAPAQVATRVGQAPINYTWLHRLMRPDQAPPLSAPAALSARRAPLRPTDRVVGLVIEGRARAYPLNALAYHRVINDRLAGARVAVAHAPLTGATLCAAVPGGLYASGALYENDDLLADTETGDLWSVLRGSSVLGPRLGAQLRRLPCHVMTWAAWRRLRPRTSVAWSHEPPRGFDYRQDPWAWYRADDAHLVAPLHFVDLRLPRKQVVLGLYHAGGARAFALRTGAGPAVINTKVNGLPVAVLLDGEQGFAAAYLRGAATTLTLTPDGEHLVDERGARWDRLGLPVGPSRSGVAPLAPAPAVRAFFFAWAALHPGTELHLDNSNVNTGTRS